jgi:hypothetical protein
MGEIARNGRPVDFQSAVVVCRFGCGANRLESLSKHANVSTRYRRQRSGTPASQLMHAPMLEADSGLFHQILDRARDQDFAAARFRGHRAPM